jgi:hypothetical protein
VETTVHRAEAGNPGPGANQQRLFLPVIADASGQ